MIHTQKKKNKIFTFICSLMPGAAEMYMGFLKNGLSILLLFMGCLLLCVGFGELFALPLGIIWIYGFFHAWNIAGLDDEDFFACTDEYVWEEFSDKRSFALPEEKMKKITPFALLFIGFGIIWNFVFDMVIKFIPGDHWSIIYPIVKSVPGLVFAILFIILGFKLLKGKKDQIDSEVDLPLLIESSQEPEADLKETESEDTKTDEADIKVSETA